MNRYLLDAFDDKQTNVRREAWEGRWQGPGTSNSYPALNGAYKDAFFQSRFSTMFLEDATYIHAAYPSVRTVSFRWLVFMERGLEFAGENRRFFDLKRMRKDDNTMMYDYMMNTYIPDMAARYPAFVNSTTVLAERKKWWPKPFTEVDRNPGVQQNQGY